MARTGVAVTANAMSTLPLCTSRMAFAQLDSTTSNLTSSVLAMSLAMSMTKPCHSLVRGSLLK